MSYPAVITLPDHYRGDRWVDVLIGPITIDGLQPANPLTRIRWNFVHAETGEIYRLDTLTSANPDAPITMTNTSTWAASVTGVQRFLPLAGSWTWDMEFYQSGSTGPLTLYKGTITVLADTTR